MMGLPHWDRIVSFEVPMWTPYGLDYKPVSFVGGADRLLQDVATYAMDLESELIYLSGMRYGEVGVVSYDKTIGPGRSISFPLGFVVIFSFSKAMEKFVSRFVKEMDEIKVGVCFCDLWDREMPLGKYKAIALISSNPFFDDKNFLEHFVQELAKSVDAKATSSLSYFAEKFGYRRFFIPYETDDPIELAISSICNEFETEEIISLLGSIDH